MASWISDRATSEHERSESATSGDMLNRSVSNTGAALKVEDFNATTAR